MNMELNDESFKRGRVRGCGPRKRVNPHWREDLRLGAEHPGLLITAEEAADVLNVCGDHLRRMIREGKLKATRRNNRHVLKIVDVLDARLGVLGERGGAP
jgi:excisionase family DNA binding protein